MSAAEVCEANLAGEREKTAQLEERLSAAIDDARKATARVVELEQEAERNARDRREQVTRVKSLESRIDEVTGAKASLESRLQQVEGQLRSETQRARALIAENERHRTQIAATERKAISLQAALERANLQVTRNYDAWMQAESQRQELAKRLHSAPSPGAMLLTGLIGLGAGVLASSRNDEDEYE
jgi:chromosome segregation ATPase